MRSMPTTERVLGMLIDGCTVTTSSARPVVDPYDGRVLAHVADAGPDEVRRALDAAVAAARAARDSSALERSHVVARASELVEANHESLARTIASEGIKTIREARRETTRCAITLRLAAEEARRLGGETMRMDAFDNGGGRVAYWTREPVGVVAAITPFNDPLNLVAHKIGPAIAGGNAVVVKPHEQTPLSALRLGELFVEAGAPPGLVQVVTGSGAVAGEALVGADDVDMVSFTGGARTAVRIARVAGPKRTTMELGQSGATIVMDDADLERAVPAVASGAFAAAGQNCLHVQRVLVHDAVYDDVVERLVDAACSLRLGDKLDPATDMGPLIDERAAQRVRDAVADARKHGARLLTGGPGAGTSMPPTLLDDVPDAHPVAYEEIFGPVTVVRRVATLDEAVAVANFGRGAVHSAVFTGSLERAHFAVRRLAAGGVIVNDSTDFRVDGMPFGGTGGSGLGREGVRFATEAMTEPKLACFALAGPGSP
ncbi:MAG TPA: aldehyde dehydrogenase family protein [Actinomycetota bacterium]|nr:aldehyde dehydrogenase family protein [Actinomycetota bacterium]